MLPFCAPCKRPVSTKLFRWSRICSQLDKNRNVRYHVSCVLVFIAHVIGLLWNRVRTLNLHNIVVKYSSDKFVD